MGSLTSSPKTSTQVVYVPVSSSSSSSSTDTSTIDTSTSDDTTSDSDLSEEQSEARKESLLKRDRSSAGTVLTSYSGLLSAASNETERKTLLGE